MRNIEKLSVNIIIGTPQHIKVNSIHVDHTNVHTKAASMKWREARHEGRGQGVFFLDLR